MVDQAIFDSSLLGSGTTELDNLLSTLSSPMHFASSSSASSGTPRPSGSSSAAPRPDQPGSSQSKSPSPAQPSSHANRKRIRPKFDLAPGQPPTARGNPRIRVFVACHQCRARKIRCDGAKPICCNCQKRPSEAEQCNYDSGPNRRGREKGSARVSRRQSAVEKAPKRKASAQDEPELQPSESDASGNIEPLPNDVGPSSIPMDPPPQSGLFDFIDEAVSDYDPVLHDTTSFTMMPFLQVPAIGVTPLEDRQGQEERDGIPSRPGTQFARDTWWDALLAFYATEHDSAYSVQVITLSHAQRTTAMKAVVSDLRALFQASSCWLSFIHLPRFFDTLFSPVRRSRLQPSLLFSALALGILAQSSEAENGAKGRERALKLLEMAHGALEGSLATGWVDVELAQAALLIVYFEMHSHPLQSYARSTSALLLLDSLFRLFSLINIDQNIKPKGRSPHSAILPVPINPAAQMGFIPQSNVAYGIQVPSTTAPTTLPGANLVPHTNTSLLDGVPLQTVHPHSQTAHMHGCRCIELSLGRNWPSVHSLAPSWASTMMWPAGLPEADFRREECRRLVWCSVMILATYNEYIATASDATITMHGKLFVREQENFSVLMPGETLAQMGMLVEMDDIWTLNLRTMMLLHFCMRTRDDLTLSPAERAQLAVQAWLEIDDLEGKLARHTCDLDNAFGFQAKEMLFCLRMLTSYDFQRYIPQVTTNGSTLFYRDKAEGWLRHAEEACNCVWKGVSKGALSPSKDHRKSLLIFWLISNIRKAIALWKADPELISGLELSKRLAERNEYLMMFWPNMRLRQVWQGVRNQLVQACLKAGIPPPSPSLPRSIPHVDQMQPLPTADFVA